MQCRAGCFIQQFGGLLISNCKSISKYLLCFSSAVIVLTFVILVDFVTRTHVMLRLCFMAQRLWPWQRKCSDPTTAPHVATETTGQMMETKLHNKIVNDDYYITYVVYSTVCRNSYCKYHFT